MARTEKQKLEDKLEKVCHDYIRRRDSKDRDFIGGYCFDCGVWSEGQYFQAGHFLPSGATGVLLRYHPHNIHGQSAGCNMKYRQETVKINYTFKMIAMYGKKYVEKLQQLKYKTIKADVIFLQKMIDLYQEGDEKKIIKYLESF